MRITGLYAGIAALLVVVLAVRVMLRRRHTRTGIGDGGDHDLGKRIRAHANAIEYLPIGLLLLLIIELNQTQALLVHVFGISLLVGRALHAFGLSRSSGPSAGRMLGTALTLLAIMVMAALLVWQYLIMATF